MNIYDGGGEIGTGNWRAALRAVAAHVELGRYILRASGISNHNNGSTVLVITIRVRISRDKALSRLSRPEIAQNIN